MAPQRRETAELTQRIARARMDCGTWRAAGFSEKYLEAYSLVGALEAELAALMLVDAQAHARRLEALRSPVEPAAFPPIMGTSGDRAQLMADLSIAYDGLRYYYESYRYDYLEDAVNYAKVQRSRAGSRAKIPMPTPSILEAPGKCERRTMTLFGITYEMDAYRVDGYRYDHLDDAVAYARLQRSGACISPGEMP